LQDRLDQLKVAHPLGSKGFTKSGIRKMIARLHKEFAAYKWSEESGQTEPK